MKLVPRGIYGLLALLFVSESYAAAEPLASVSPLRAEDKTSP